MSSSHVRFGHSTFVKKKKKMVCSTKPRTSQIAGHLVSYEYNGGWAKRLTLVVHTIMIKIIIKLLYF